MPGEEGVKNVQKPACILFFQMEIVENFFLLVADVFTQEVKTLLKNRFNFEHNLWDERMP